MQSKLEHTKTSLNITKLAMWFSFVFNQFVIIFFLGCWPSSGIWFHWDSKEDLDISMHYYHSMLTWPRPLFQSRQFTGNTHTTSSSITNVPAWRVNCSSVSQFPSVNATTSQYFAEFWHVKYSLPNCTRQTNFLAVTNFCGYAMAYARGTTSHQTTNRINSKGRVAPKWIACQYGKYNCANWKRSFCKSLVCVIVLV